MEQAIQAAQEKLVPPSMYIHVHVRRAWPGTRPLLGHPEKPADQSINQLMIHDDSAACPRCQAAEASHTCRRATVARGWLGWIPGFLELERRRPRPCPTLPSPRKKPNGHSA